MASAGLQKYLYFTALSDHYITHGLRKPHRHNLVSITVEDQYCRKIP